MPFQPRVLYIPPVPRAIPAGGWGSAPPARVRRPPSPPVRRYTQRRTAPIGGNGVAQSVVAAGKATVRIGPSGTGTRWYPQQITLATTSGAADTSTATGYLGPVATSSSVIFQSYAGGGDIIGLAVPVMQPGDLLTVVWSGAHNGDWAQLVITGDQEILSP
jgi:hypothetical protein